MKRQLYLIFALLMLFSAVCPPYLIGAAEPVTINWSVWGSRLELTSHEHVASEFMKTHPDIKINIIHYDWEIYHEKLKELIATGDPKQIPDVMFLAQDLERFADAGMLEPLNVWIENSNYDLEDYWPSVIERATVNDEIFGFQRDMDMRLLYYNKDIFDEAKVSYPTNNWTWEDWREAAEALTAADSKGDIIRYGLGMEPGKWDMLLLQNGGQMLDDRYNPSKCTVDQPAGLTSIEFLAEMLNDGIAMRPADLQAEGGDAAAFIKGKVAMIIQNSSRALEFNNAKLNYDVAPIPIPEDGQRVNNGDGARFVMSSRSEHKEQAWEFLRWLQSKEGGQTLYTSTGEMFPALRSVASSDVFMNLPQKPGNREAFIIEASNVQLLTGGSFPEWIEMNDTIIQPLLNTIWAGEGRANEVARNLCARIDEFLQENGYPQ